MPASPITGASRRREGEGIAAPLLLHYAGLDERINAGIPAFEEALKAAKKTYELHIYPGVNHAFNNDTSLALRQGGGGPRLGKYARVLQEVRALTFPQAGEGILRNPVAST